MENKENLKPGLFGIKRSNRDYSLKDAWGRISLIHLSLLL